MCKAIDIANAFLEKIPFETAKDGNGINKVSLQKLLFFAQEYHLFSYNEPLFKEKIYAWQHGPVIKDAWHYYNKNEKAHNITYHPTKDSLIKFTKNQSDTISHIWEVYGNKSEWYLESLSHAYKIWKDKKDNKEVMSPEEILSYRQEIESSKIEASNNVKQSAKKLGLA